MCKGKDTYRNEAWLREQYITLGKTDRQIASDLGIASSRICDWRHKNGIMGRPRGGSIPSKATFTKTELTTLYVKEQLTDWQIGKLVNATSPAICYLRKKYGIPAKTYSKCNKDVILSQDAINFINGELLGDGHAESLSKHSGRYTHGSQYMKYLIWLSSQFANWDIQQCGNITGDRGKRGTKHNYCTRSYACFRPLVKQWYPNGEKIIPRDLKITPITLRQFYIGDGYLSNPKRGGSSIVLCTECFSINDIDFLRAKFEEIGIHTTRQRAINRIYISVSDTPAFLDYIGECPEEIKDIYNYKWEIK